MKTSLLLFILLLPACLLVGSQSLTANEVWSALFAPSTVSEEVRFIVTEFRLPQMLTALFAGVALALSGLVMQTLFGNPLADPSLLGVSSGASLGAALALLTIGGGQSLVSLPASGALLTIAAAFGGACGVIALLAFCSHYLRGNLSLLVTGVMLSFVVSALITLLNFYATADGVRSFVIWGMGDFSSVPLNRLPLLGVCVSVPAVWLLLMAHPLNALLLGADYATNLGIRVRRIRTLLLILAGLLTACVTALCGPISFVGLAVPHMARLLMHTADHRKLLPVTMFLGADVAMLSLILTHLPGSRGILPLAAITPLLGVPVVMYILIHRR